VVGRFPTGVIVASVRSPDGPRLMTANSFTSVSLEPPLVLICVELTARFHQAVLTAGEWGVSVLAADQEEVSRAYARRSVLDGIPTAAHRLGPHTGAPLLDGAVAQLECRTVAEHPGGDHTIVVGAVLDAVVSRTGIGPLLYHQGRYGGSVG